MAYVQVPPDSTGKKVDTNTIGLTERQIAILGDAVSSGGLATVTTSAGLMVNVTSGTITISGSPTVVAASSGLVQVIPVTSSGVNLYTTAGINVVSASSGQVQVLTTGAYPVLTSGPLTLSGTVSVVNTSSGLVQVIPVTSSGVNLYTTAGINVVSASSGIVQVLTTGAYPVLTSGPLTLSGTVSVVNTSSGLVQILPVTSSGVNLYTTQGMQVILTGSSGLAAPVTSSGGVLITASNTIRSLSSGTVTLSSNPTIISATSGSVQVQPWSTGQVMLSANYVSSSSNSSTNVKSSGGTFYGFYANNTTNVTRFLKIYGTSSAPAAGTLTSAILGIYGIIASTGTGGAGAQHIIQPFGLYGTGGIAFTVTANAAATDTGTTGANDINFTLYYI